MMFVAVIGLSLLSGCTTGGLFSSWKHKEQFQKATPSNPVVRCLCLWEPAEGTGVDNKPARGLAGQIFFFTRDSVSSVAADGDVRIFMFDDQGTEEEQGVPLHQFDFRDNTFRAFLAPTQFGPAYQLFVPYSRKGRHQAELAIRVRLAQPGTAAPVFSDLTKVVLLGHERLKPKSTSAATTESAAHDSIESENAAAERINNTDVVTPQLIEQTFRDIRLERQGLSTTDSTRTPKTPRPQPRASTSGGEFSVTNDVDEPRQPSVRKRLRQPTQPLQTPSSNDESEDAEDNLETN
jgi:hypothetical protein